MSIKLVPSAADIFSSSFSSSSPPSLSSSSEKKGVSSRSEVSERIKEFVLSTFRSSIGAFVSFPFCFPFAILYLFPICLFWVRSKFNSFFFWGECERRNERERRDERNGKRRRERRIDKRGRQALHEVFSLLWRSSSSRWKVGSLLLSHSSSFLFLLFSFYFLIFHFCFFQKQWFEWIWGLHQLSVHWWEAWNENEGEREWKKGERCFALTKTMNWIW